MVRAMPEAQAQSREPESKRRVSDPLVSCWVDQFVIYFRIINRDPDGKTTRVKIVRVTKYELEEMLKVAPSALAESNQIMKEFWENIKWVSEETK